MLGVEVEENSTSEKTPTLQSPVVDNDVEVLKSATIADLKLGVQNVFDHLPNDGPDKIHGNFSTYIIV
ncbi:hypothetical protein V6N13_107489 [Hibiscus sabdariffa]|uniref:Uncharacterized protein n=1 Tax=Hibiscus sabdariffa TaxID=183260 RepID=A0ABR2SPK6_9ROSI